ncbi:LIM and calponin homology domains-containing protein 1-like isoform X3 [Uloborus diversus]|uniref:LIM and calponin homology domains-containing protein 1-like isoform X3 n=1 Tax=Uloborus diversus TaxID=327109 RepID=UPI00240A111A|nr:LIM and calponin homology domains-containing protein 1-like isoform X3 [Uloborus diversus]
MPGTTRYSATFDRTYEEDDRVPPEPAMNGRRSRSLSLQANGALYTPLPGGRTPQQRSSSTDNGPGKVPEHIPTRTVAKTTVKSHTNPFQFVKVGTCPLYRKAEEQLKKAKEVKKPEVLKEEEEEWQTNLDSWKSRRRKMSEDVFRRQEEIKQFEMEEQVQQCNQRKTKTFSEMLESRAHRGRALSLCLLNSPLDSQIWEVEGRGSKSCANSSYSGGSEENSTVNSEDEGVSFKGLNEKNGQGISQNKSRTNGISMAHSPSSSCDGLSELETNGGSRREGHFVDSGLESLVGSHGAADTPDSCSDSSHDGRSSLDCDSPTTNGSYENGHAKVANGNSASQSPSGTDLKIKLNLSSTEDVLGFTFQGKQDGQVVVTSMLEASNENSHMHQNGMTNGYASTNEIQNGHIEVVKNGNTDVISPLRGPDSPMNSPKLVQEVSKNGERSIESENEMYVDDFEECGKSPISVCSTQALSSTTSVSNQTSSQKQTTHIEESISIGKESINIIFESHPTNNSNQELPSRGNEDSIGSGERNPLLSKQEVVPVEKVAEEMEKLILEQLEEEERAKELAAEIQQIKSVEHLLTAPPRLAEPPKEKPPPPPISSNEIQKPNSLKRVNSTKRIKKEIHKRRSNFLGIENTDENIVCDESSVPPPLALEEILKAEMELDRESRKKLENATVERLTLEEKEIMQKEREIIETLESEERRRLLYGIHSELPSMLPNDSRQTNCEEDRILDLQEERKRLEEDHLFTKEKQLILERAEYIKRQEESPSVADLSAPLLSAVTHFPSPAPSLSSDPLESNSSASPGGGDGNSVLSDNVPIAPPGEKTEGEAQTIKPPKPIPPPKPLKKKEAIRKERERLRQEQEALQREKEEHRRKLAEQEELLRNQKSHGDADCLLMNGPMRPVSSRIKSPQNDAWGQQKVPSVRKQNPDALTEIRYNQNHWLIQEAEMRRIAEQRERLRAAALQSDPRTHLAEDDVCSARGVQKYPPAVSSDKPLVFSRRNVLPPTPPAKPSRQQEHVLSVSGRKRCSHCGEELGRGAAMIIESLQLYYHIQCFQCCVCQAQLGNGSCGTDVRVRNNKLHCHNCYSNDEAGLKFSQV